MARPWIGNSEGNSCWLILSSSNAAKAFGLEGGPPTIQWLVILRVAGNVAKGQQEVGEPQTATWTGKDWACHRADIQGICLS